MDEAAKVTGVRPQSIYSEVSQLELPAISHVSPFMFSRAALEIWLKDGKQMVAAMMHVEYKEKHVSFRK